MYEINKFENKISSLSIFVGTGNCNAKCRHCAGIPLRKYAPKEDGIIDADLISRTIRNCYDAGARYLSLSSSGEPTLSPLAVTKALYLIKSYENEGIKFSPINLYSNGIRIGTDASFSDIYLPIWKSLNLTTFYITVHDVDEKKNAKIYGVKKYPSLEKVFSTIKDNGFIVRANLVLSTQNIGNLEKFVHTVQNLMLLGVDKISAWPVRNLKDEVDSELSPSSVELDNMEKWVIKNKDLENKIILLRETSKVKYTLGQKLTLFPDGTLSNKWCNF